MLFYTTKKNINKNRKIFKALLQSTTWVLNENIIQKLPVFERKILRGIFGPTKENQTWRIKNNEELDKLIKHENIVNYIKAQRLAGSAIHKECLKPGQLRRYLNGIP